MDQLIDFTIWFIKYFLPSMIANASPLLIHGVFPIDKGIAFIDKKPIFGRNKTVEGFLVGVYMGFSSSIVLSIIFNNYSLILLGLGASISSLLGDLFGSFIKRRLGIKSGDPFPILDQLDFMFFTIIYYALLNVKDIVFNPCYVFYACILVLILHIITNNVAYYLGVKDKRW